MDRLSFTPQFRFDSSSKLRSPAVRHVDGNADPRGETTDVRTTGGTGARRQGRTCGEPLLEAHFVGKFIGPQKLQQPEEPVGVVFKRRRTQKQYVTAERRDRRDRAIPWVARMSARPPYPLRLVEDEEIDACAHRLLR